MTHKCACRVVCDQWCEIGNVFGDFTLRIHPRIHFSRIRANSRVKYRREPRNGIPNGSAALAFRVRKAAAGRERRMRSDPPRAELFNSCPLATCWDHFLDHVCDSDLVTDYDISREGSALLYWYSIDGGAPVRWFIM